MHRTSSASSASSKLFSTVIARADQVLRPSIGNAPTGSSDACRNGAAYAIAVDSGFWTSDWKFRVWVVAFQPSAPVVDVTSAAEIDTQSLQGQGQSARAGQSASAGQSAIIKRRTPTHTTASTRLPSTAISSTAPVYSIEVLRTTFVGQLPIHGDNGAKRLFF